MAHPGVPLDPMTPTPTPRASARPWFLGALSLLPTAALVLGGAVLAWQMTAALSLEPVHVIGIVLVTAAGAGQLAVLRERRRLLSATREVKAELELARLQRADADSRYRGLVEHVPAAVYEHVEDGTIPDGGRLAYLSPQIEAMLGYPANEFLGDQGLWLRLIHPDDRDGALAAQAEHRSTGSPLRIEHRMVARDGRVVWVRNEAYALPADGVERGRVSQGMLVDTSDQKRLESQLLHDALHDPLTGLANRVLFRDHVDRALARRRRGNTGVAVLFLDLDDFKIVNDSLGHRAGDRLLVEVGNRIGAVIRGGEIAGRQGGDEFTVLLESVPGVAAAMASAERLAGELRRPVQIEGRSLVVTASIGIALAHDASTSTDDLLANADAAMYVAKAEGKARVAPFDPSMRRRVTRRLEREADLRAAIDADEFELHYQPIVELPSQRIVGFEALCRWRHPQDGLRGPGEFIPMAEATGLIVPLGRLVTVSACDELRRWRALPGCEALKVNVNVSVRQATEPGFAAMIRDIVGAAGIEPSALVLEITESLMLHETAATDGALRQLRTLGVGVVVDDFGTGFSALDYFKRFAVQGLKLDRSFVAGLGHSREDTAIVTATLAFGAALGLSVTAEGVETADQADRLLALGCDRAQGYLFGRPMPAADAMLLLSDPAAAPLPLPVRPAVLPFVRTA